MDAFSKKISDLRDRAGIVRSQLSDVNGKLDCYQAELDAFVSELDVKYGHGELVQTRDSSERELLDLRFQIRVNTFCCMVTAMLRLVRADPKNAMTAIKIVCETFHLQFCSNSNVKADNFEACFLSYVNAVTSDSYWLDFDGYRDGAWYVSQPQEHSWEACIGIQVPVSMLDSDLSDFTFDMLTEINLAAANWASRFVSTYADDVQKRRALYDRLRVEFENNA